MVYAERVAGPQPGMNENPKPHARTPLNWPQAWLGGPMWGQIRPVIPTSPRRASLALEPGGRPEWVDGRRPGAFLRPARGGGRLRVHYPSFRLSPKPSSVRTLNIHSLAAYDDLGELVATCSPNAVAGGCNASNITTNQSAWRYVYDLMGHQTSATPPNNDYTNLAASSSSFELSGAGRPYRVYQSTRTTTYAYDAAGRQNQTAITNTGFSSITTSVTLDSLGRQTQISAGGDTIDQVYDALGRMTSLSRGGLTITASTYNPDGTAASRTDYEAAGTAYVNSFTYATTGQLVDKIGEGRRALDVAANWVRTKLCPVPQPAPETASP